MATPQAIPDFKGYVASLRPVSTVASTADPESLELCARVTAQISAALPLSVDGVAAIIAAEPHAVPVIAAAANVSQERLRTWLQATFGTAGWVALARQRPHELAAALENSHGVVALLQAQAQRTWTWADVLARTMSSRQRADSAVQ